MNRRGEVIQRKSKVPWMFLDEWKKVYEDIYSNDIERQKKGYERLLLWKARQPNLPAGVECTLELIYVHILDQEVTQQIFSGKTPMHNEKDLQLMCSTAVMRYLNHVANVAQSFDDTLYTMACKVNIPDWIVNMRNHTAHKTDLPPLAAFRMAVKFALDWLHENYWNQPSIPSLVISKATRRFSNKRVAQLLDIWQSIKMYQINGFIYIDEIPDKHLRGLIIKLLSVKNEENTEERILENKTTRNLEFSIKKVRKKLFSVMKTNLSKIEKLLGLLMEIETFIPPAHYISQSKEELTEKKILLWLCKFWEDFLIPLQCDFNIFPNLVHKLIMFINEEKCRHRQLVMALWIKQLCISMLKSRTIMSAVYEVPDNIISKNIFQRREGQEKLKPKVHISQRDIVRVQKANPHLKNGFFAPWAEPKGNWCPLTDVKFAVLHPNEFTEIFLSSLLDVANPEIPESSKWRIQELVSIWLKPAELNPAKPDNTIHTVNDFQEAYGQKLKFFEETEKTKLEVHNVSKYDWATCPLGILPWQKESYTLLDIPAHITWHLSEEDLRISKREKKQKRIIVPRVKKHVNWVSVVKRYSAASSKKKQKKKEYKLKKMAPLYLQNT